MKQMCKKKFQSPCVCRNELSNPGCLTVSVTSSEPRLQTTVRQLGLKGYTGVVETNYTNSLVKTVLSHQHSSVNICIGGIQFAMTVLTLREATFKRTVC